MVFGYNKQQIKAKFNLFYNGLNVSVKIEFIRIIFIYIASVRIGAVSGCFTEAQSLTPPANSAVSYTHCDH